MHINAKTVLLSALGLSVVSGGVWFFMRKKKESTPEAVATTNPVADTQTQETPANIISTIVDSSLQSVGLGESRGIKNNNPLNIKWDAANNWIGQIGADSGGFVIFDTPDNGIRAAAKILRSYAKIGLVSIRQIVTRWTSGDSTKIQSNYSGYVSKTLGIPVDAPLNTNNWAALLSAMTYFENGKNPYQISLFVQAVSSAGV